jgi:neutral ceramidase
LDVGQISTPYAWSPNIVDIQSFRVGEMIMIISPSEATTMSGRRWKTAVGNASIAQGITKSPKVVLGGPANTYAHYCATREEYGIQRYEGASTLYGPNELDAYIYLHVSNLGYLSSTNTSQPPVGPLPPNNVDRSLSFISPVVLDNPPLFKKFGDVTTQPNSAYKIGDVVNTTFVGANPRNNLRQESTFTEIQQKQADGSWKAVRNDNDWHLVYSWSRTNTVTGTSSVVISWETESYAAPGTYRTVYYGDSKSISGTITAFIGTSNAFTLS